MIELDELVETIEFRLAGKEYSFPAPTLGALEKLDEGIRKAKSKSAGDNGLKVLRNFFKECGVKGDILSQLQPAQLEKLFTGITSKKKA